jgi:hypothetical protein
MGHYRCWDPGMVDETSAKEVTTSDPESAAEWYVTRFLEDHEYWENSTSGEPVTVNVSAEGGPPVAYEVSVETRFTFSALRRLADKEGV